MFRTKSKPILVLIYLLKWAAKLRIFSISSKLLQKNMHFIYKKTKQKEDIH